MIVTVKLHVVVLPDASVAVQVTVLAPRLKVAPVVVTGPVVAPLDVQAVVTPGQLLLDVTL